MTRVEEQRAALEAIAYGDDPRISPRDRMDAIERLGKLPGHGVQGTDAMIKVAAEIAELSDEQLERELAGFMDGGYVPPPPPSPGSEADIEQRVRRRIKMWAKSQGVSLRRPEPEPRQVPAEPERVAAEAAPERREENVVPPTALEKRRLAKSAARAVKWAERIPPCPEGVDPKLWELWADAYDGV